MSYSDRDLLVATQIAYYDIAPKYEGFSLREILNNDRSIFKKLNDNLKNATSELEKERAKKALDLYNEIISPKSKYGDWVIKDVNNDNSNSGFYGCLIETDDNSAVIGFRGSESYNLEQKQKDWVEADLGLLNSELTNQQSAATKYMDYINSKYNYREYSLSGHSLGGNLAAHAGITAPESMQNKIIQCYSYDGPGFSDEYIVANRDAINRFGNKITHYQWSIVGALLNQIPGESFKTIKTRNVVYGKNDMDSLLQKHDTCFVEFDENDNVICGDMDDLSKVIGELSRNIDNADAGNKLVRILSAFITMSESEKKALITGGIFIAIENLVAFPISTIGIIATIASVLISGYINPEIYANVLIPFFAGMVNLSIKVTEFVKTTVTAFFEKVKECISNFKEFMNEVYKSIERVINKIASWLYHNSTGYKYSSANPYISVDTTSMSLYASQLRNLSRRSKSLDWKMNSLYWQMGIDWNSLAKLGKLLKAGINLDCAGRLDMCANYLESTANEFNDVEQGLLKI